LCIYWNELYPEKVRGVAAATEIIGGLSSTINPLIIGFMTRYSIGTMIYFTLLSIFGVVAYTFLPETHRQPLKIEIE
jgi:uncharacterized membrane protein YphA (DoxX/SURF4 family)